MIATQSTSRRVRRHADGTWSIDAHAKLNLGLRVFPARPDGFHDLETWMVPTSWHDTLRIEPGSGGGLSLEVTGRTEGVPTDLEKNLVGRAALKLAAAAGLAPRGKIVLHKVLPPGGGIGGGSSDAAAALVALNQAWGLEWDETRLEALAAELGSDIPFFVRCRPSLCTGRGEIMTPLHPMHPLYAVLILPPMGCPTRDVYQAFDRLAAPMLPRTDWEACASSNAEQLSGMLVNDLEPAAYAVAPTLAGLRRRSSELIGRPVHMTGSGSTLFTLCSTGANVDGGAALIQERLTAGLAGTCVCVAVKLSG